jgi:hypothetical protein
MPAQGMIQGDKKLRSGLKVPMDNLGYSVVAPSMLAQGFTQRGKKLQSRLRVLMNNLGYSVVAAVYAGPGSAQLSGTTAIPCV